MPLDPIAFAAHYRTLSGYDRQQALYGLEEQYNPDLLDMLLTIASDQQEHDLARIEAVKVLGLSASSHPEIEARVLALIVELATHDPDDDVRLHAFQALRWLPTAATARELLRPLAQANPDPTVQEEAQGFPRRNGVSGSQRRVGPGRRADRRRGPRPGGVRPRRGGLTSEG